MLGIFSFAGKGRSGTPTRSSVAAAKGSRCLVGKLARTDNDKQTHCYPVLAHLPVPLFASAPTDYEILKKLADIQVFYQGIADWLWSWETEIVNPKLSTYPRKHLEGYALLAESRYKLIRGLFNRHKFDESIFPKPAFVWLLCESSACRKVLENTLSKVLLYERNKEFLKQFANISATINSRPISDLEEMLFDFDLIIDFLATGV